MDLKTLFADKSIKPKDRTTRLSEMVADKTTSLGDLIVFAKIAKDPVKATCIESLEFASKVNPSIMTSEAMDFVLDALSEKAPRIKWESAKVTGNAIHLFQDKIDLAVTKLLDNATDTGTVVRWSAAFALSQILKLKTEINESLAPAIKNILNNEEKNSIKKIYLDGLKKSGIK